MAQLSSPETGVPILKTADGRWRRIVMPLLVVAVFGAIVLGVMSQGRGSSGSIAGGGSTLAQPLIESAAVAYRKNAAADNPERPAATGTDWVIDGGGIDYETSGSLGGILRLKQGQTDFAISDYPLSAKSLADTKATQFPIAVGAVAVVHNVEGLDGGLRLDAKTLADIYRGDITSWDDDAIADLNPQLDLPSLGIEPVHRSDGSGSTYGLTGYLARDNKWADGPGQGPKIDWPTNGAASRSSGMIDKVSSTAGAIGYVEPQQAKDNDLALVALENFAGRFAAPKPASITAALTDIDWDASDDFTKPLQLSDESRSYPITVGIYAMVTDQGRVTRRSLDFLAYIVDAFDVTERGYVELPDEAKKVVRKTWVDEFDFETSYASNDPTATTYKQLSAIGR